MARSKGKPSKRARSILSLLLFLALLLTINAFMEDPIDLLPASAPAATGTPKPALPSGKTLDIYVLDVGQGDSIFLRSPSGKTMLVDAGESYMYERVDEFLQNQAVKKLDVVIGTHPHADHIGGMEKIVTHYTIGTYYMPDAQNQTRMFENLLDALAEQDISVKQAVGGKQSAIGWDEDVEVNILSPLPGVEYDDLNDSSVILHVQYGETSILLTGDAESFAEKAALKALPESCFRATVLKVGHHGSSTSSSDAFLDAVGPELAVVSLGKDNEYGHPHKEVVDALKSRNIPLYRTDTGGTVHISLDGEGYTVETEK
ncbi:MAG TPA: ComEC/Rec2 family competence protein [Feifaniaceae bacterium]|nr:ComEC/Rec2 family competence protein [Feifaniaceae bacterium]